MNRLWHKTRSIIIWGLLSLLPVFSCLWNLSYQGEAEYLTIQQQVHEQAAVLYQRDGSQVLREVLEQSREKTDTETKEGFYRVVHEENIIRYLDHLDTYPQYLENMKTQKKNIGAVSIFKKSGGGFLSQNAEMTVKDFSKLSDITLTLEHGTSELLQNMKEQTILWIIILLFAIVSAYSASTIFHKEERNLIFSLPGGRSRFALRNCLKTVGRTMTYTAWCYFLLASVGILALGCKEDLAKPVQCLVFFREIPWNLSLASYLMLCLLMVSIAAGVLSVLFFAILEWCGTFVTGSMVLALIMTVEMMAYTILSPQNRWAILRYFNLYGLLRPWELLSKYRNLNLGGYPVRLILLLLLLMGIVALTAVILSVLASGRRERGGIRWMERILGQLLIRWHQILSGWMASVGGIALESYRYLIGRGALLILVVGIVLMYQTHPVEDIYYTPMTSYLNDFYSEWWGPCTQDAEWEIRHRYDQGLMWQLQWEDAQESYVRGEITFEELENQRYLQESRRLDIDGSRFLMEELEAQNAYEKANNISLWLVNPTGFRNLLGERSFGLGVKTAMIWLGALILMTAVYGRKNKQEDALIHSLPEGRAHYIRRKKALMIVSSLLFYLICQVIEWIPLLCNYTFHGIMAPAASLEFCRLGVWAERMNLGQLITLMLIVRLMGFLLFESILEQMSRQWGMGISTAFGLVFLLLPMALRILGISVQRILVPGSILIPQEILIQGGGWAEIIIRLAVLAALSFSLSIWGQRKHLQRRNGHG